MHDIDANPRKILQRRKMAMKWDKKFSELLLLFSATLGVYIYPHLHTLIKSLDSAQFSSLVILIIGSLVIILRKE